MRLCLLCSEYPPGPHGGIGTVTCTLARALAAAGHEVRVVGSYAQDHPALASPVAGAEEGGWRVEADGDVRVWRAAVPRGRLGWARARRQTLRLVEGWARRGEIDLVEAPDWGGVLARWPRLPIPVTVRVHGSATYFAQELGRRVPPVTRWLEAAALRRADAWCSVGAHAAAVTRRRFRLPRPPAAVLPNPVPAPACVPPVAARPADRVVFTGTLTAKKGIMALLGAWPAVRERVPAAELHVAGRSDGGLQAQLAAALPPAARGSVRFHGHLERAALEALLASARVAVFPSYSEACAVAPLEAMAHGCATISTRRSAGPEFMPADGTGLLADPDDPAALARLIAELLQDEARATRVAAGQRAWVRERFSLARLVPANEIYYAAVIAAGVRGRAAARVGA